MIMMVKTKISLVMMLKKIALNGDDNDTTNNRITMMIMTTIPMTMIRTIATTATTRDKDEIDN